MAENVVLVRFEEPSKTYEALSILKKCDAEGRIELEAAAVVERTPAGQLRILESTDNMGPVGTVGGSLIGMLVGVLGGPVGVLLGWGAGAAVGGVYDIHRTALLASVDEPVADVIDAEMDMLGGTVTRRSVDEVMVELEAADEAAEAAEREARRVVREQRKAKLSAHVGERVGKVKEKLHAS